MIEEYQKIYVEKMDKEIRYFNFLLDFLWFDY
jgi:hypothetical protein